LHAGAQLILKRVVAQIVVAERNEERLRRIAATRAPFEDELAVARAHRETMKSIVFGMTALRATPRSRTRPRDAERLVARSPTGVRPWEEPLDAEPGLARVEAEDGPDDDRLA
jgi:hypothetical protein